MSATDTWAGLGISSFDFRANRLFLVKNEQMSYSLKKINDSLISSFLMSEMSNSLTLRISSEWPEQIAHGRSFVLRKMSNSLTVLTKKEEMSD